jgi:uncharacterized protein
VPLLWQHRDPIGLISLSDSPQGLKAEGKLSMALQQAVDAYILLRDGVVKGLSIGFETIRSEFKGDVRQLLELKLFEVSLVTFPMNELATISGIKSANLNQISRAAAELKQFRESFTKRSPRWTNS